MIQPVKNLHGLSPIEDWIQHSQWLEQERDKYRDACERLIGHYGAGSRWLCYDCEERGRCDDHQERVWDGPGANGHDFARQVKAEIEGGA